jgi:FkbM family methyltransferase
MPNPIRGVARLILPRRMRNWLRRPGPALAWLRDAAAHALGRDPTVEIRADWRLRCHPAAFRLAYRAHIEDPEQVPELDAFIASCTPGLALLDIGAHFGLFSLAALHYGGQDAVAVAVDPSPTAARMVAIQARLNGVEDRLRVVRAAVASQDGEMELVDAGVGAAGYFVPPERGHGAAERTRVAAVTVDTLVRQLGRAPTHIKVDVEGYEADVLRGAGGTLAVPDAPRLFIELHNEIVRRRGGEPSELLTFLDDLGYAILGLDGSALARPRILSMPMLRVVARRDRS